MNTENALLKFAPEMHKIYLTFILDGKMPSYCSSLDTNRAVLMYFAVGGLDILNALDSITDARKQSIIDWIYSLQIINDKDLASGFQGSTNLNTIENRGENTLYKWAHIANTYACLATLLMLRDNLERVNRPSIINSAVDGVESDMRFVFCAASISYILNDWSGIDVELMVDFILNSIRHKKAEERKETLLTGGGPPRRPPDDPTQDLLLGITDPLTVFGDENNFESDNIGISKKLPTSNDVSHVEEMTDEVNDENKNLETDLRGNNELNEELNDSVELGQIDRNWKKQTIPNLKNKISNVLKRPLESNLLKQAQGSKKKFDTSRRRPTSTVVRALSANDLAEKYQQLADKKILIADYTLEKLKNEVEMSEIEHNLRCKSYDGGIGQGPELESHCGSTFCAVASLALSGNLDRLTRAQFDNLRRWLLFRFDGGFNGRPNKPVDTCYSFWTGGALKILDAYDFIQQENNHQRGGFAKWINCVPDPMHSYLGLAGLSLMEFDGLNEMFSDLNVTKPTHDFLEDVQATWQ
nr:unnamed protein product [Callosobruchus analis]